MLIFGKGVKLMIKRITGIISALIFAVSCTGCNFTLESKPEEPTSAEALVESYYSYLSTQSYSTAYQNCYSLISKGVITEEEYYASMEREAFLSGMTVVGALAESSELVSVYDESDIYLVSGTVKYLKGEEEITDTFSEYVIHQSATGFYRILHEGIVSQKIYTMPAVSEKKLHSDQAVIYTTVTGKTLALTMSNDSISDFSIGKGDKGPLVEVLGENGKTYSYRFEDPAIMNSGDTVTFTAVYSGLDQQITKITLSSIYPVGQDGNVIENTTGQLYSVSVM